jgi:hypothetical protein
MTSPAMTMVRTLGNILSRSIVFVASAWRAATWKHFLFTSLLGLAWSGALLATLTGYFSRPLRPGSAANAILSMQFNGFAVLLAILVADRASPPPLRRYGPYLLAVVVGVAAGSTLLWLVSQWMLGIRTAYLAGQPREGYDTFVFRHGVHGLVVCGLAAYVYVSQRMAAHRVAALRVVQLDRAQAEKRILESRLATMQARVDPLVLRNTFLQLERLYESDAPAADRVLRELIAYLRAAIPQTPDPGSTVEREIRLTNAYLNMVGLQSKDRLVRSGSGTSIDSTARMPPMILLPLINHALAQRAASQGEEPFEIDVVVRNDRVLLTAHDPGSGFASSGATDLEIVRIRERLAALYADKARLDLRRTAEGSEAVLDIPHEVVPAAAVRSL